MQEFIAYTDGSCNNLSPYGEGGSAYVLLQGGELIKKVAKGFVGTTNNRMEMLAIISAVNSLPIGASVVIYTDSKYCIGAFTRGGSKNQDLINLFHHVSANLQGVEFRWVKGHNGNQYNEMVDRMAAACVEEMRKKYNLPLYTAKNSPKTNRQLELGL